MAAIMLAREGEVPAVTVADLLLQEAAVLFNLRDGEPVGPNPPRLGVPAPPGVVRDLSLVWVRIAMLDGLQSGLRPGFYFAGWAVTATLARLRRYMAPPGAPESAETRAVV